MGYIQYVLQIYAFILGHALIIVILSLHQSRSLQARRDWRSEEKQSLRCNKDMDGSPSWLGDDHLGAQLVKFVPQLFGL